MASKPTPKKPLRPPPPKGDKAGTKPLLNAYRIELDRIIPDPDQPRREFDPESIDRLSDSIVLRGQLLPARVYWSAEADRYVIIDGERRYRALLRTNIKAMECVIEAGPRRPDRSELTIDQLTANCHRQDLTPLEQARAFRSLLDARGWKQAELARALQLSPSSITRALALLTLPEPVQASVESGELSPACAYEVSKAPTPETQIAAAAKVVGEKLSRSEAASAVRGISQKKRPAPENPGGGYDPERRTLGHWSGVSILAEAHKGELNLADLAAALRKALDLVEFERQAESVRRCRACGCTEQDCSGCIERTGSPCVWVDADLCSACQPTPDPSAAGWRLRPARSLPGELGALLEDSEIGTLGQAWDSLESGSLVSFLAWTPAEAKELEAALVAIRAEAGDPAPCTAPLPKGRRRRA